MQVMKQLIESFCKRLPLTSRVLPSIKQRACECCLVTFQSENEDTATWRERAKHKYREIYGIHPLLALLIATVIGQLVKIIIQWLLTTEAGDIRGPVGRAEVIKKARRGWARPLF